MKVWIARDKNGTLFLYDEDVPQKTGEHFMQRGFKNVMILSNDLFPEVTFENSPQEAELKLVK